MVSNGIKFSWPSRFQNLCFEQHASMTLYYIFQTLCFLTQNPLGFHVIFFKLSVFSRKTLQGSTFHDFFFSFKLKWPWVGLNSGSK